MKRKIISALFSLCLLAGMNIPMESKEPFSQQTVKRTHGYHPEIDGFSYSYGYIQKQLAVTSSYGYIYYDMDVYFAPFTSSSRLYLIHAKGEFTSGYIANQSGQSGFDSMYDLDGGIMSTTLRRVTDNTHASSSIVPLAAWPLSSSVTTTVTSSYGATLTLGSEFETGVSIDDFSIKKKNTSSIQLSYNYSVSSTSVDPRISTQTSATNGNQTIWTFRYATYGRETYVLDTYYLFEAKNDGNNYQDYSFAYDINLKLDAVACHGLWWENHQYVEATYNETYGLY